jgi:type IV pilus assembly protein PilA
MKKNNKKGFTLAELLIVVAIIAVLTAIAIPVFTSQLEKSRESTDMANVRSAYAALVTGYLADNTIGSAEVSAQQTVEDWQTSGGGNLEIISDGGTSTYHYDPVMKEGVYVVTIESDASTGGIIPSVNGG